MPPIPEHVQNQYVAKERRKTVPNRVALAARRSEYLIGARAHGARSRETAARAVLASPALLLCLRQSYI